MGLQWVKHVKNVAGTVREACEEVLGKVQDALYWGWRRKALSMQLSRRRRDAFFVILSALWACLGEVVLMNKLCLFARRLFDRTGRNYYGSRVDDTVPGTARGEDNRRGKGEQGGTERYHTPADPKGVGGYSYKK